MLGIVADIIVNIPEIETKRIRPLSSGSTHNLMRQSGFDSIISNVKISTT